MAHVTPRGDAYSLSFPKLLVKTLNLKPGDRLRIKIEEVTRV